MTQPTLRDTILAIGEDARASAVAVAAYDFAHHTTWSLNAHRWFHAASTIKVPVLLAVYEAIAQGRFEPQSRVHVRNRFLSVVDGRPFRVPQGRDANDETRRGDEPIIRAEHRRAQPADVGRAMLLGVSHSR